VDKHELLTKLSGWKNNLQNRFSKKKILMKNEDEGFDHYLDDLPLTINRDPGPGVTFYTTENSEFSRGLPKGLPKNIDSFSEERN
jgi:hypothetical protein